MFRLLLFAHLVTSAMRWVDRGLARALGAGTMLAPFFLRQTPAEHEPIPSRRWSRAWWHELWEQLDYAIEESARRFEDAA
jgi:hypothetical protein